MKSQIPLHVPQLLPIDLPDCLLPNDVVPSEQQLTQQTNDDDYYKEYIYLGINTKRLVHAGMHAFSSEVPPGLEFLGRGSFNEVFILRFPNDFKIVARVPRRTERAAGHIEATVAMMTMARCYSRLPVPEVYAWHPDKGNAVGVPYMLLEWVEGIEPWRQWHDMSLADQTQLLDQIANYHAAFAKPLPFQGIRSIYFVEAPATAPVSFDSLSAYRLGPLCRGPACSAYRGVLSSPQDLSTKLRDFWLGLWKHEVDYVTESLGSDRSTAMRLPGQIWDPDETYTLGQFLEAAQAVLTLIQKCTLPHEEQSDLLRLCFAPTDWAMRNMLMDPQTRRITTFLDWDDVYVLPFLLCSRYPQDICCTWGCSDRWIKTGAFQFLPWDEEGELEEDLPAENVEPTGGAKPPEDDGSAEDAEVAKDEDATSQEDDDTSGSESTCGTDDAELSAASEVFDEIDPNPYPMPDDRPERIRDTRHRRQYELLLSSHDSRFESEDFWDGRVEPLKVQEVLMLGWPEWVSRLDWLKTWAAEMSDSY